MPYPYTYVVVGFMLISNLISADLKSNFEIASMFNHTYKYLMELNLQVEIFLNSRVVCLVFCEMPSPQNLGIIKVYTYTNVGLNPEAKLDITNGKSSKMQPRGFFRKAAEQLHTRPRTTDTQ